MMIYQAQETLVDLFSEARLRGYRCVGDDDKKTFTRYQDNIRLSQSLYPALHYLEVVLRNRLNNTISHIYGDAWLIELPSTINMDEGNLNKLYKAKARHLIEKRCFPTQDDLVAHMTFGFWVNLFHKRYDPSLWQRKHFFASVFPNTLREQRKRSEIQKKLYAIKDLRNRIAHHEPIWNQQPNATAIHGLCIEIVGAMSKEALARLKEVDRFTQ